MGAERLAPATSSCIQLIAYAPRGGTAPAPASGFSVPKLLRQRFLFCYPEFSYCVLCSFFPSAPTLIFSWHKPGDRQRRLEEEPARPWATCLAR